MFHKNGTCIDAGTGQCPCVLAACGECLTCSRLAGEDRCDCQWQGVCIYNQYIQNGKLPEKQRSGIKCKIQKKTWYEKDLAVIRLEVPRGFAEKASLPGSYVFVRPEGAQDRFDMPISVMKADHGSGFIELAVKEAGPKSKALLREESDIHVRGVYRNGLIGVGKLTSPERKKVLCLTKGTGLAAAANYCRWAGSRDNIDLIVDLDKITKEFAIDIMDGCSYGSMIFDKLPLGDVNGITENYDLVMISASDWFQENILLPHDKIILSNNRHMCCGEGICGACIRADSRGVPYRMCKCTKSQM